MAQARVTFDAEAVVTATLSREDVGGELSQMEDFIDDMELESLTMLGRDWTERDLRVFFGDQGADALVRLIFDNAEDWEDD